ncbi:hypothetical protein D3C81_1240350 [compost metagenome]
MLGGDDQVDLLTVVQDRIKHGQQRIGVRRQILADELRLLVSQMAQQTWILVRISVVILLEHRGGCHDVQGRDLPAPAMVRRFAQPFKVLGDHRIDYAQERFVAGEEAVATR